MTANLLDNALKFTPPGGRVELTLALRNGAPVLEVRDTGCGISPAEKEKIFKRFYRIPAGGRKQSGSGIGLAIVKHIALYHHGTVSVRSIPGKGAEFHMILPLDPPRLSS